VDTRSGPYVLKVEVFHMIHGRVVITTSVCIVFAVCMLS
jgi:hypothetical protein